jgi:hypothetical protein
MIDRRTEINPAVDLREHVLELGGPSDEMRFLAFFSRERMDAALAVARGDGWRELGAVLTHEIAGHPYYTAVLSRSGPRIPGDAPRTS